MAKDKSAAKIVSAGASITAEANKLKRGLTLIPLTGLIYFTVCGGSFGIEPLVGSAGPGLALILIAITPIIFSLPNLLIVRELQTMMPAQGGYYHWIKRAFGPFAGFLAGWNNWVVSWLDVSIYPVFAALYLSAFIPALDTGTTLFGIPLPASLLQWLVAVVMIWFVAWLQIRGSRVTGFFTNSLGVVMIIPLMLLALLGFYAWFKSGVTPSLPFLPGGVAVNFKSLTGAFSVGLFVVMWNYMGWELPSAAGDEVVEPRKTYPRAMAIVLVLAILTYSLPVLASLYGGAGEDGRYAIWGIEASDESVGIGADVADYGVTSNQIDSWGVSTSTDATGWEFPQIGQVIAAKVSGSAESPLAILMLTILTISAVLSMIGLFIGNSLGGSRVPFALAEDGMFPRWMVKVHPQHGSPYVSILVVSVIYTIFATNAFEFLVVADVFLQLLVVLAEVAALWMLRRTEPDRPRDRVPGGMAGLVVASVSLTAIILIAFASQIIDAGWGSIGVALALMSVGAVLYFPIRKLLKPGVPDVDPFEAGAGDD
jgi:amino acid transporter